MTYLLITDTKYRKTFDVVSILKSLFPQYTIILGKSSTGAMSLLNSFLTYGSCITETIRTECAATFEKDLDIIAHKYRNDTIIYIPIEEETTNYFCTYIEKKDLSPFQYLLPSSKLYKLFRNKGSLNKFCLENNFNAPQCYEVSQIPDSAYPIILKPETGSGSTGIYRISNKEEFTDSIKTTINGTPYLAQELIPNGNEVQGAFFLCSKGNVLGAYTHQRIRTMPEEGGVTVCSRYSNNRQLIEEGRKLLEFVKWEGVIMLEYLYDKKSDKYKLIEANPRLWGSIMLSEFAGIHLLENYVNCCLGLKLTEVTPKDTYIRWPLMDFIGYIRKKGNIDNFWKAKNTCFINWTYARKDRALFFLLSSIFNLSNLKKLIKKI